MSEHDEQCVVIEWAKYQELMHPELALLFAIPNGARLPSRQNAKGQRYSPEAQRLKAEGLRRGIPDLCLPVARHGYHSLWIELKHGNNKPSPEQVTFLDALNAQGHLALLCVGAQEAIDAISEYLGIENNGLV